MDSPSITLPSPVAAPRRPPTPFVAALVPVAAGVVLWMVTGSLLSLCFAALGPLMILASLIDGARSRRSAHRRARDENAAAWTSAEEQLARLHDDERRVRWHRHPDAATALAEPPLRGAEPVDATTEVVVGSGPGQSGIRVAGGDDERGGEFRRRCSVIDAIPVSVAFGGGIAVRGGRPVVASVVRALVVQMSLKFGAAQIALVGEGLDEWGVAALPQAAVLRRGAFRVGLARGGSPRPPADAVLWALERDAAVPEGITTVIDVLEPHSARMRTPRGVVALTVECLSYAQAVAVAAARTSEAEDGDRIPDLVRLADLDEIASRVPSHGLAAAIGRAEGRDVVLDIVDDGPHALVTGTTGSGKSELLVSWVTAIALRYGPEQVSFVLADFKGGTAFEPLRSLPQVAAVITDLDEHGARRGVSSLTAELRRREGILAAAGAREVREVGLVRLVIVVDEFAALLQEHPDLGAVFTDIAARGRALGMHLILGTQRAAGVVREALAANCPLRLSLRVSEASDSRFVIGSDAAADLPGGLGSRGLALVRRPQDADAVLMRVGMTTASDRADIAEQWRQSVPPQSPWLPALPRIVPLVALRDGTQDDRLVLGLADEPEHQRQPLETLAVGTDRGIAVIGGPGSGRTAVVRALTAQSPSVVRIPRDLEGAWDTVTALADGSRPLPALVACDDIDAQLGGLPAEHAQHLARLWEQTLRAASGTTFVLTATRAGGAAGRILEMLPERGLLRMASRVDHLAAGGDSAGFDPARPPGRMRVRDREVQVAWVPGEDAPGIAPLRGRSHARGVPYWRPHATLTGLVTAGASAVAALLASAYPECDVRTLSDGSEIPDGSRPVLHVGDAESWQRSWSLWQRVRANGEILIRVESPGDLRQLAGVREVPPYARPNAGRAWSILADAGPRRVVLPALSAR